MSCSRRSRFDICRLINCLLWVCLVAGKTHERKNNLVPPFYGFSFLIQKIESSPYLKLELRF